MKGRKYIAIILSVLCFTLWFNSALACSAHGTRYAFVSDTVRNYNSTNNSQHSVYEKTYYMCRICMLTDPWTSTSTYTENHAYTETNGGHVSGTTNHRYLYHCTKCGHDWTKYVHCEKPGCPVQVIMPR